jgi:hypothetical protein
MAGWIEHDLIRPIETLLASVPVGDAMRPADLHQTLGRALDGVFGAMIDQYASWPSGAWIDGATVELCIRSGEDSIDVVGLMWLSGTVATFPYLAQITHTAGGSVVVVGSIGQVDQHTGRPPHLRTGCLIAVVRDDQGVARPELIEGHRQIPIVWTRVLEWSAEPDE